MPIERSAGVVVFRRQNKKIEYLLLHYGGGYWDFPKGHIEKGESEEDALRREVFEETGIKDLKLIPGFRKTIKYFFKKNKPRILPFRKARGKETVFKIVVFYLALTRTKKVKISFEHIGYKWLPYSKAEQRLTFKNAKDILKTAHQCPGRIKNPAGKLAGGI